MNPKSARVGAGDLATSSLQTGSLPLSILEFPSFFVLPNGDFRWKIKEYGNEKHVWQLKTFFKNLINMIPFTSITYEALRNYHYLWTAYINDKRYLGLFCQHRTDLNCTISPMEFEVTENKVRGLS